MSLIYNWRQILKKAWSFRLAILSGCFSGLEILLPLFAEDFTRGYFAGLSIIAAVGAAVSRVVAQPEMHRP